MHGMHSPISLRYSSVFPLHTILVKPIRTTQGPWVKSLRTLYFSGLLISGEYKCGFVRIIFVPEDGGTDSLLYGHLCQSFPKSTGLPALVSFMKR